MKANDFLTKVIESLGLVLGVDGEVMVMTPGDDGEYISDLVKSKSGFPFLLPTNKNLNRLVEIGKGGKVELKFLPFNPIQEDDIGVESQAFKSFIKRAQTMLTLETYEAGSLLLSVAKDDSLVESKGIRVEKFLTSLGKHITTKNMKIVDDNTFKHYNEMIKNCKSPGNHKLLHLTVKRNGDIDGSIYPVVVSIHFPLMEAVLKLDSGEDGYINDVKLRKKDIIVFKEIFRTLFPMVGDDCIYKVSSSRKDYPMFDSTYRLYLELMGKHKEIISKLGTDDEPDLIEAKISISHKEIDGILNSIGKEIERIPNERTLVQREVQPETEEIQQVNLPQMQPNQPHQQQYHQPQQQQQMPQQHYPQNPPLVPVDAMGNIIGPIPSGYQNPNMMNFSQPQMVNSGGYAGNVVNTINAAMNPYAPQPTGPYNPLNYNPYGQGQPSYLVGTNYGYDANSGVRPPLGMTGGSEF